MFASRQSKWSLSSNGILLLCVSGLFYLISCIKVFIRPYGTHSSNNKIAQIKRKIVNPEKGVRTAFQQWDFLSWLNFVSIFISHLVCVFFSIRNLRHIEKRGPMFVSDFVCSIHCFVLHPISIPYLLVHELNDVCVACSMSLWSNCVCSSFLCLLFDSLFLFFWFGCFLRAIFTLFYSSIHLECSTIVRALFFPFNQFHKTSCSIHSLLISTFNFYFHATTNMNVCVFFHPHCSNLSFTLSQKKNSSVLSHRRILKTEFCLNRDLAYGRWY